MSEKRNGRKPNILLLMTDQQRFDTLGCYGCQAIETPNLDRLASEGVLFENCYINATLCTPSRASLLTGKPVPGHGVYRLHDNLPRDEVLIGKHLQERGYRTALIGKLHVSGRVTEAEERHPNDGFDVYEWCLDPAIHLDSKYNSYASWLKDNHPAFLKKLLAGKRDVLHHPVEAHFNHWAADRTISFLEEHAGGPQQDRPFFCFMSILDPHSPYFDHPAEYAEAVDRTKLPDVVALDQNSGPVPKDLQREREYFFSKKKSEPYTREEILDIRHGYHASIAYLDFEFGRVLSALEKQGLADNTLVIFTSDHGDMIGDHGLIMKGAFFYDPCTRVPLIMRYPGSIAAGTREQGLVQLHDLAATILASAGFEAEQLEPIMPDAVNLLPPLREGSGEFRDHAVCLYRNSGYGRAADGTGSRYHEPPINATMFRAERYKLNLYHDVSPAGTLEGELYDLELDRLETRNLWNDPALAETKAELIARALNWIVANDSRYSGSRGGWKGPWQN